VIKFVLNFTRWQDGKPHQISCWLDVPALPHPVSKGESFVIVGEAEGDRGVLLLTVEAIILRQEKDELTTTILCKLDGTHPLEDETARIRRVLKYNGWNGTIRA
jgi:hypothetical protein